VTASFSASSLSTLSSSHIAEDVMPLTSIPKGEASTAIGSSSDSPSAASSAAQVASLEPRADRVNATEVMDSVGIVVPEP
jgi:hypothetical protein